LLACACVRYSTHATRTCHCQQGTPTPGGPLIRANEPSLLFIPPDDASPNGTLLAVAGGETEAAPTLGKRRTHSVPAYVALLTLGTHVTPSVPKQAKPDLNFSARLSAWQPHRKDTLHVGGVY
jgi:hypothetical protein